MSNREEFWEAGSDDPRFSKLTEQVDETGRHLGIYLEDLRVGALPHPSKVLVVANFRMGDLATRQRTLDPQKAGEDDEWREIEDGLLEDQFEAIRRRMREGKPFDPPGS